MLNFFQNVLEFLLRLEGHINKFLIVTRILCFFFKKKKCIQIGYRIRLNPKNDILYLQKDCL